MSLVIPVVALALMMSISFAMNVYATPAKSTVFVYATYEDKDGTPYLLTGACSKTASICIPKVTTQESKLNGELIIASFALQTGIKKADCEYQEVMTRFYDRTTSRDGSHYEIHHVTLKTANALNWDTKDVSWTLTSVKGKEIFLPPLLNHGLDLLVHSFENGVFLYEADVNACKYPSQSKAIAYITRNTKEYEEFLAMQKVEWHWDGNQAISGTIEEGEDPVTALYREVEEESGLERKDLLKVEKLTKYFRYNPFTKKLNERHVFRCELKSGKYLEMDKWIYEVKSDGSDNGMHYNYQFFPLTKQISLYAGLGQGLDLLLNLQVIDCASKEFLSEEKTQKSSSESTIRT